jgi:diguanylate cyclase (GGDEF)-like protein
MFMLRLQLAVKRSQWDRNYLFAVLFLDLDRFKVINDSLGHTMGDRVLIAISQLLQAQIFHNNQTTSSLRDKDFLSRFGGDEFTILLDDIESSSEAIHLAEKIQNALKKPIKIDHHEVFLSSSIGIVVNQFNDHKNPNEENFSLFSTEEETPALLAEDIMRDVDIAMYWAKAMGKGRYAVFYPGMRDRALKLMQLETDLRQAIEHKKLLLHYQPIVSLQTNRISGFEALVRWPDPIRGMVPPLEFIGVAEETGLIIPLGSWVIQQACQQMRLWQTQFPASRTLTMSVNLSGHQFTQSDLIENIDEILQQTGLKPDSLKLEITETSIAESVEYAGSILKKLRDLGIKLCIDDFGTGYSSLSRLHELPLDTLKIDKTFVSRLGKNGENSEMLEIILTLAHNLNMDAVAEGIETIEQLNQLLKYNCEYGQGYFFSKPVDSKVATSLLEAQMKKS